MAGTGSVLTTPIVTARTAAHAEDWRAAVRAACRPLVEAGAADDRYERSCVRTVLANGPYIVLAPGIALAHARPEDGARRLGLGVAVLATPVAFGHPANDPVDVVFAFCSPSRESHLELLGALSRALVGGLADRLRAAPSDDAAATLLREVAGRGR